MSAVLCLAYVLFALRARPVLSVSSSFTLTVYSRGADQSKYSSITNSYIQSSESGRTNYGSRGFFVAAYSYDGQKVDSGSFDTFDDGENNNYENEAADMESFLNSFEGQDDRVIAIVSWDSPVRDSGYEIVGVAAILNSWGCQHTSVGFRESFAFVGLPTGSDQASWAYCDVHARDDPYILHTANVIFTDSPTTDPTTGNPTATSNAPSPAPSADPSVAPSRMPSSVTAGPTTGPSLEPSKQPSDAPTGSPSDEPTPVTVPPSSTTAAPTADPSRQPSQQPSEPTDEPTGSPSVAPTPATAPPSKLPSRPPTVPPSAPPSPLPTAARASADVGGDDSDTDDEGEANDDSDAASDDFPFWVPFAGGGLALCLVCAVCIAVYLRTTKTKKQEHLENKIKTGQLFDETCDADPVVNNLGRLSPNALAVNMDDNLVGAGDRESVDLRANPLANNMNTLGGTSQATPIGHGVSIPVQALTQTRITPTPEEPTSQSTTKGAGIDADNPLVEDDEFIVQSDECDDVVDYVTKVTTSGNTNHGSPLISNGEFVT